VSELGRRLSDSLILPFNAISYAEQLVIESNNFKKLYKLKLDNLNISLANLDNSIVNFGLVASKFHSRLEKLDLKKYHLIRIYNDQLKNIEKAFLDPIVGIKRDGFQ
jgi:hypothetical protein